jgi:hypothetical protein
MSYSKIAVLHKERFGIRITPRAVKYWVDKWKLKKIPENRNQ